MRLAGMKSGGSLNWLAALGASGCVVASVLAGTPPEKGRLVGSGGGSLDAAHRFAIGASCDCVSQADRVRIAAARESALESTVGPTPQAGAERGGIGAPIYEFFPMAGTLDQDIQTGNWVDLDPSPGRLIWDCSDFAADGHRGVDVEIRSFAEQAIGAPVFAIADGVVTFAHDGEPDMNTQLLGQPSNLVVLNHGGVRESLYYHLKNGSVAVGVGEVVRAGQQIGMVASSGNSGGPHLHLEHIDLPSNEVFEPWAGACRPGASGWLHQPAYDKTLELRDFGVTATNLGAVPGPPFEVPAFGALTFDEQSHYIWILVANLPANSDWKIRWIQPDGQTNFESPTFPFNNAEFFRRSWWWFNWYIFDMTKLAGTWRIQVVINGQQLIDAPIEVAESFPVDFNRPPAPITCAFDPPLPKASNVIFCRVNTSLTLDDPDFDVVRFNYRWLVDGVEIRNVTTAALSDAIARDSATAGQTVTCMVTPSDGAVDGAMAQVSVVIAPALCLGDADFSGAANFDDITEALTNWLADYSPGAGRGDANGDGVVNFDDITAVLTNWLGVCP